MTDNLQASEYSAARGEKVRALLVDDQKIIAEAVKRMFAGQPDISLFYCPDPAGAIDAAKKCRPTVILQDLVMPEVDGLTLVKFFRACPETRDIPLVVLSSKEDPDVKYRAFENGANDYMVKFPDKLEVLARVRYHSRAYTTLRELNDAMARLQQSQNALKKELDEAGNYVTSLLPEKIDDPALSSDWVFKSSTELGGDCFGYGWLDENRFAVYLLDVCGHGVGAALLSVSAMNALRSRTLSGVDFGEPDQVLCALNSAFDMDSQNGMFFTLWYGVYDKSSRELSYASRDSRVRLRNLPAPHHKRLYNRGYEPDVLQEGVRANRAGLKALRFQRRRVRSRKARRPYDVARRVRRRAARAAAAGALESGEHDALLQRRPGAGIF